jgi:hypothetical protein
MLVLNLHTVFDIFMVLKLQTVIFCSWQWHSSGGSRRFATTAARVRAQVRSCGIRDGQSGTGASFLLVLWFPLPILTHQMSIFIYHQGLVQ